PRLLAATFWEGREDLLARTLDEVRRRPGIDPGWKEALLAVVPSPRSRRGERVRILLDIDTVPYLALSLHTFRRRPWPAEWPLIELHEEALAPIRLPPATALGSTAPSALLDAACAARGPAGAGGDGG
nr:hypothetical protein [Acidobacteriota bacterium]